MKMPAFRVKQTKFAAMEQQLADHESSHPTGIRREWFIFLTTIQFLTRIPVRTSIPNVMQLLERTSRYFPLVGMIVGLLQIPVFALLLWTTHSTSIAIWGMMFAGILITGAFHEDGFADMCDAFGGGWAKTKILEIMKDSRLGTFGVVGLIGMLGMKHSLLVQYQTMFVRWEVWSSIIQIMLITIFAHGASRLMPVFVMQFSTYVRDDVGGKSKPLATQKPGLTGILPGLLVLGIPVIWMDKSVLLGLIPMGIAAWWMKRYFEKWIGGYTGDCLGAVQQVTELIAYLTVIVLWKFGWYVIPVLP